MSTITRRGVVWLGQTCNLRCEFCYFLDRIEDESHPEHPFITLEKAKEICRTLVDYYGNNSVDIQGGEPTSDPHIYELVAYCAEIGLSPTIITNAQALASRTVAAATRRRAPRLPRQRPGARPGLRRARQPPRRARAQMRALRNLQEEGIPFRFNTVVSEPAAPPARRHRRAGGAHRRRGRELPRLQPVQRPGDAASAPRENVPRYDELRAAARRALDILAEAGVEANVRYLPFCVVAERHRELRLRLPPDPLRPARERLRELVVDRPPRAADPRRAATPTFGARAAAAARPAPRARSAGSPRAAARRRRPHRVSSGSSLPGRARGRQLRRTSATARRRGCGRRVHRLPPRPACSACDCRAICDGFYGDYVELFGADEARPIASGARHDPQHFSRRQEKRTHPLDREWLGLAGR